MPRITITTDDGEVIEMIDGDDMGDLSKPLAQQDLLHDVVEAVEKARKKEDAEKK
jgi:hypothetical protein